MPISSLVKYSIYFADNGVPKTGLSPVAVLYNREANTYVSGIVSEINNGFYTMYVSGSDLTGSTVNGYVDGGDQTLADTDRFVPIILTEFDYALDAYSKDLPKDTSTQVTADHGSGIWVSGTNSAVDTSAIAVEVNTLLTSKHGVGIWTSGTSTTDNDAIAQVVNNVLTSKHGGGIWTSGTSTSSADIALAVDTLLSASHGSGSWSNLTSGANAVTINVIDQVSAPIAGVLVYTYNSTETTLLDYSTTNSLGTVGLALNDGTYKVRCAKYTSYTFVNPQTLTVAGNTSLTCVGTLIAPSPAPSPETCVVIGRIIDDEGNPIARVDVSANVIGSKVTFRDGLGNIVTVGSQAVKTISNSNGVWTLTLIRSAHLYDSGGTAGVKLHFKLKGRGVDEEKDATIPDASTANYEDL